MGKYTNLFAGIFVFSMGYFLEAMYTSVSREFAEDLEVLPIPIDQIILYVRFIFLGIGVVLILAGLVGIIISVIKKSTKKEEEPAPKKRAEEGYREKGYPEGEASREREYEEKTRNRESNRRGDYRKESERAEYPKDKERPDYREEGKYRDERESR